MSSEPDILIVNPSDERMLLAVEAKSSDTRFSDAVEVVKRFMFAMRCPSGVAVTPNRLAVLWASDVKGGEAIEVREFAAPATLVAEGRTGVELEMAVRRWLNLFAEDDDVGAGENRELKAALYEHVLPALVHGEMRAGHPRNAERARRTG